MEDIKYCVVVREGENAKKRQEFYAPRNVMEDFFKTYTLGGWASGIKHVIDVTHIVFTGNPEDIKKSGKSAKAEFTEGYINSLELNVDTEEDAVKCLKYFKLR